MQVGSVDLRDLGQGRALQGQPFEPGKVAITPTGRDFDRPVRQIPYESAQPQGACTSLDELAIPYLLDPPRGYEFAS